MDIPTDASPSLPLDSEPMESEIDEAAWDAAWELVFGPAEAATDMGIEVPAVAIFDDDVE